MKKLNKTLIMMLLIVGGLIFADDCLAGTKNTGSSDFGIGLAKSKVELTTSFVFHLNNSDNSYILTSS